MTGSKSEIKIIGDDSFQTMVLNGVKKWLLNGRSVRRDCYQSALIEAVSK